MRNAVNCRFSVWLVMALLVAATPAAAQTGLATVTGNVHDESGGAVPGVTVTATNQGTNIAYTGVTNDIGRRIHEHRTGARPGFTRRYCATRLVYVEWFRDARNAIAREKQIKGGSRADKVALIERVNPEWKDLAVEMGLV